MSSEYDGERRRDVYENSLAETLVDNDDIRVEKLQVGGGNCEICNKEDAEYLAEVEDVTQILCADHLHQYIQRVSLRERGMLESKLH